MEIEALMELLAKWPKEGPNGEPSELWVETGFGLSSPAKVVRLNATDLMVVPADHHLTAAEAP